MSAAGIFVCLISLLLSVFVGAAAAKAYGLAGMLVCVPAGFLIGVGAAELAGKF